MPRTVLSEEPSVVVGYYMPRAFLRMHTKRSQWDFCVAIMDDVLRVYPGAKVEISGGNDGEQHRRLEVMGANPDDVQALVTASEQANKHILKFDKAKAATVVRILK